MNRAKSILELAQALIRRVSVTPEDAGCQELIGELLRDLGFVTEQINAHGVHNLWAWRGRDPRETDATHLMFAGHTDVVPSGPPEEWNSPPFEPTIEDGMLYGRGAADMKSSLAAMIYAIDSFLEKHPNPLGTLSFLITSDEEGDAVHGTRHAIRELASRGIRPDYCVIGEPSSSKRLGDVVRCGRRGSLNGKVTVNGVQGHVAYPESVVNPIHRAAPALAALANEVWDTGNDYYPPSSLQISNIQAGTGATNVVPGELTALFNIRFNTEQTEAGLRSRIEDIFSQHGLQTEFQWQLSGPPFLTVHGKLTAAVQAAIKEETGLETELSTSGGTSDGRFISPWDGSGEARVEVVELGPINATIHKINECVAINDLAPLAKIYEGIALRLLV